jgi:hypothetical protein
MQEYLILHVIDCITKEEEEMQNELAVTCIQGCFDLQQSK